jgi:outer membrane lipoprotein SlyB
MRFLYAPAALLSAILLASCASTGSSSPSARPVFYPNPTLNRVGNAQAQQDSDQCMRDAESAGLTPDEKDNAVAQGAAKGAAMGGVAGAVGAVVNGRNTERVLQRGAAGAAVGGSVGAVAGAFRNKPSATFRHYVQQCLHDKGYNIIGWN